MVLLALLREGEKYGYEVASELESRSGGSFEIAEGTLYPVFYRLEKEETGEAPGWTGAILRRLPFFLEIFWIDALFALFTRRRQRAFDLVARTLVVRT